MKKMHLEIIVSLASVAIFIILIIAARLFVPSQGYGYTAALLIFVTIMGIAGLKLAEISES